MTQFPIHTLDTAPADAKPLLEKSQAAYGFIPNLHAAMADSPAVLGAYQDLTKRVSETHLDAVEQTVAWMTLNRYHNCHYCIPAHTAIAHGSGVPADVIVALREGRSLTDPKLEALRRTVLALVERRGQVTQSEVETFFEAGYGREHLADLLVVIAHKTMSNYFNAFFDTPVDDRFAPFIADPLGAKESA